MHAADYLVAWNKGQPRQLKVSLHSVQIRVANAAGLNLYQYLYVRRLRDRNLSRPERALFYREGLFKHHSSHWLHLWQVANILLFLNLASANEENYGLADSGCSDFPRTWG